MYLTETFIPNVNIVFLDIFLAAYVEATVPTSEITPTYFFFEEKKATVI
jgi:hypothetical protein